jgi:eukaryotic-like serine/threonine-protein kinase
MSIDTVDALLHVMRRAKLLAPEQVDEVARELGPLYDDPAALADYLVDIEWLTAFQRDMLFDGNPFELTIGSYLLLSPLGEGGVGQVFKAWDCEKGRIVALKVLRQDVACRNDALRQFHRELEAVTRLNHPNIIKTFDAHQLGHMHYFAMEYVEGVDLQRYVSEVGPLSVELACDYIRQVAQGLQHAHLLGLVHRDVKPANLLLIHAPTPGKQPMSNGMTPAKRAPDPIVKILDWGLARIKPPEGEADAGAAVQARITTESEKGQLIGTADYVAPEQARDPSLVDTRADIYSLGCTFYFLLASQPPFPGNSLMQKLHQHQQAEPPSIQQIRSDVPEEVDAILRKMLAKRVEDRFQIPLLVVAPLRRYCPGSIVTAGSVIRPTSSSNLGNALRPSTSAHFNGGPASSPNLGNGRPASSSNLSGHQPGNNGTRR